jgi:hypothetical protein
MGLVALFTVLGGFALFGLCALISRYRDGPFRPETPLDICFVLALGMVLVSPALAAAGVADRNSRTVPAWIALGLSIAAWLSIIGSILNG